MILYSVKRACLAPYIAYMRHKEREQTGFIKSALELHYYRPSLYRFITANAADPDMLYTAPLGPDSTVYDIGAYNGDWATRLVDKYDPHITAFEVDPARSPQLTSRFHNNPKVMICDYGLHNRDGVFQLAQRDMGSTLFNEPFPASTPQPRVSVRVRDIASVLSELAPQSIDLMKINIEGAEFAVLDRLIETAWMPRIRCLMVQFHEWIDGAHYRRFRIRRALRRTHDQEWNYAFVWEKWRLR
jgi:FkbM family methyltransferase